MTWFDFMKAYVHTGGFYLYLLYTLGLHLSLCGIAEVAPWAMHIYMPRAWVKYNIETGPT